MLTGFTEGSMEGAHVTPGREVKGTTLGYALFREQGFWSSQMPGKLVMKKCMETQLIPGNDSDFKRQESLQKLPNYRAWSLMSIKAWKILNKAPAFQHSSIRNTEFHSQVGLIAGMWDWPNSQHKPTRVTQHITKIRTEFIWSFQWRQQKHWMDFNILSLSSLFSFLKECRRWGREDPTILCQSYCSKNKKFSQPHVG